MNNKRGNKLNIKKYKNSYKAVFFLYYFFSNDWFIDSISLHETDINRRTFPIEVFKVFFICMEPFQL